MFLKKIVLNGFKSFADRTEFEFGPGITSIVGPNGCGKSNVLDAVRWVLGEQSARTLRGTRMLDVVFAGSRSRKPANFAEVELTFDNRGGFFSTDTKEVVVSRTLYRSGESEYRLNGETSRLKTIKGLFLDTGVGVNAYSIIEQGRVDVLLQSSPMERREIFEEAAGISRYRVRRAEAQRKLERTQNNLLRLHDVIEELERRLRSVRLAAGKARNYQAYDERLRALRASFSLAEYHQLELQRQQQQSLIETLEQQQREARASLGAQDAQAAEQNGRLQKLDEEMRAHEERIARIQSELSAVAERLSQGERRIEELKATRERRQQQAAEMVERVADLEKRLSSEQDGLESLRLGAEENAQRVESLREARAGAEEQCEAARDRLDAEKTAAFETVRRAALLNNEQQNLTQQRERLVAQATRLAERQQQVRREQHDLAGRATSCADQLEQLDAKQAELSGSLRVKEEELETTAARLSELQAQISRSKEKRSGVTSRLHVLEDMERRQEGVDQGTRAVLAWRERGRDADENVLGLVADLLRVDDPRVGLLQAVLATFENHVVVRSADAFMSVVAAEGELPGPVRVIALDQLREHAVAPAFEGVVARAADWVVCADEFRTLAEYSLGRTYVVDRSEQALSLASSAPAECTFVTLSGEAVSADGRLAVGVGSSTQGLISRKAEIRQLRGELDEIETSLEQATRQHHEAEGRSSDLQLQRSSLLDALAEVQRGHATARAEQDRVRESQERADREAKVIGQELGDLESSARELDERVRALRSEHEGAEQARHAHETKIGEIEDALGGHEREVSRLSQELTEALVALNRTAEKRSATEQVLADLRLRLEALGREREAAAREAEEAVGQIEKAQEELRGANERQQSLAAQRESEQSRQSALGAQRSELRASLERCGEAVRGLRERLDTLESQAHQAEVRLREVDVRQENLVTRLEEELELDLRSQYEDYEPEVDQDWESVREEIDELRQKIARLGHVNLDAIQELEELTPRYDNLISQRDDLLGSVEQLEKLIEELDHESRVRFEATFSQIRAHFQELFRKLFGGGKADIILEDPESPLECGIEIIARPPGKEPQSISLLSGGEKTMTAVGLLMAVFKSKPSPFAILDEVDAALDEANIERFNNLIQEFLAHSQFVVITHSKRTMQCADVLYGVTMEEPGVSKRVSVRFEESVQTPSVA